MFEFGCLINVCINEVGKSKLCLVDQDSPVFPSTGSRIYEGRSMVRGIFAMVQELLPHARMYLWTVLAKPRLPIAE